MPRNGMFADDGLVLDFARWARNALTGHSTRMDGMDDSISNLSGSVDTRFTDAETYADTKSADALTDAKAYTDAETATKQDMATLDDDVTALGADPTKSLYGLLESYKREMFRSNIAGATETDVPEHVLAIINVPPAPFPRYAVAHASVYMLLKEGGGRNVDIVIRRTPGQILNSRVVPLFDMSFVQHATSGFTIPANTAVEVKASIVAYTGTYTVNGDPALSEFTLTLTAA